MPRKVRELKADLRQSGFQQRSGKGSHTVWTHPLVRQRVTLSGADGDDAPAYQEKRLRSALDELRYAERRSGR